VCNIAKDSLTLQIEAIKSVVVHDAVGINGAAAPNEAVDRAGALPAIILFQAMPKGAKLDLIVRQATEVGVREVVPFFSEHSEARRSGDGRLERLQRIIKEARQQSGSQIATTIHAPLDVGGLFDYWTQLQEQEDNAGHAPALGILLYEGGASRACASSFAEQNSEVRGGVAGVSPAEGGAKNRRFEAGGRLPPPECAEGLETPCLARPLEQGCFHEYLDRRLDLVAIAVGPEGGFSQTEAQRFADAGFKPATIAGSILRAETAALFALAVVKTLILEKEFWTSKTPT
jgi:16S rRNA (uracil1498-N3)-methyltransferase